MKKIWNSFLIAFAMFSKIPVPRADWDKENMRYMMCFFPLIGVVIGVLLQGLGILCTWLSFGDTMRGASFVLLPVLVTGGIHMDGFLDTTDALSSWQPREKKLEILKDSHAGAFAIIMGCSYFVLALGVWSEMDLKVLPVAGLIFVVSRTLSSLALSTFPKANKSGSLSMFSDAAHHSRTVADSLRRSWNLSGLETDDTALRNSSSGVWKLLPAGYEAVWWNDGRYSRIFYTDM